uniref:Crp/Fnr family transcriptional regulator n=1 Tax=Pedobacter schmidteae TaxID=2201271 RepID=UPI000EB16D51|nr:Crp/Fnr family transcriptional regulator [Pedobacter schmidteae]
MIKQKFINYLDRRRSLSPVLKVALEKDESLRRQVLKKGTSLLLPKMEVAEMHYLASGMCKAFWLDENNEEQIYQIWVEDSMVNLWEPFFAEERNTLVYLVLMEDSELLTISKAQLDMICLLHTEMLEVLHRERAEQSENRNLQVQILMRKEGDRYELFEEQFPWLKQRLTEKDLCSFLAIGKTTLFTSRRLQLYKRHRKQ